MSTPSTSPPEFGKDIEPTEEMIARGAFGNGSYGNDTSAMQIVRAEKRRLAIERKENRRIAYEDKVVETLGDIADFQDELIQLAKKVTREALQDKRKLDKIDMDVISKGLKAADQVSNRVLGLASRLDDKAAKQDGLSFLIGGQEPVAE
jgi:hypothetical protein